MMDKKSVNTGTARNKQLGRSSLELVCLDGTQQLDLDWDDKSNSGSIIDQLKESEAGRQYPICSVPHSSFDTGASPVSSS